MISADLVRGLLSTSATLSGLVFAVVRLFPAITARSGWEKILEERRNKRSFLLAKVSASLFLASSVSALFWLVAFEGSETQYNAALSASVPVGSFLAGLIVLLVVIWSFTETQRAQEGTAQAVRP